MTTTTATATAANILGIGAPGASASGGSKFERVSRAEAGLLLPTYERYPVLLARGRGVYVYDDAGRKYLDLLSGIGVNSLGYQHPAVVKALKEQAARVVHVSNLFYHEYQAELARRLTKISGLDRVFFCNSGTEAWEAALKLARAYARLNCKKKNGKENGKKKQQPAWRILALENSFHGRTMGALSTTATKKYRAPFEPLVPGVRFVRANDVADLKRQFDSSVCAIGVEVLQGEGGINPLSAEFLQTARALAKKNRALLLCDEIQSGLGRTGKYFAYQHHHLKPDIVTVAKPLAAGLPLGAVITTEAVAKAFSPGMHGTTFGGGPLACSVAVAVLDTMEREGLLEHIRTVGDYFKQQLIALGARHEAVKDVRGMGLMLGLELDSADLAKAVFKELLANGIIINRTHDTVLRFLPPFIITEKHVDAAVKVLDTALAKGVPQAAGTKSAAKKNSARRKP